MKVGEIRDEGIKNLKCKKNIKNTKKMKTRSQTKSEMQTMHQTQTKPKSLNDMPVECPCGGGQSCLIDRRWLGDWCPEDELFNKLNIPLRKSCIQPYTVEQEMALTQQSITYRWNQ